MSSESEDEVIEYRRHRIFRERVSYNVLELTYEYNERFRMRSQVFNTILGIIEQDLLHPTQRNKALSPKQQLQIALHWLGTGAQYHAIGDMHGVSKASVCRVVKNVVYAVNRILLRQFVKWPENIDEVVHTFYEMVGMPLVCGALDGTLIKIDAPSNHEAAFVDRHGNHSINVMLVCGPDYYFYYCCANWPGSVNDARILRTSNLYNRMEQGWRPYADGVLLGDSIYPLKTWLIPPIVQNPEIPSQIRFARAHKRKRRIIENAIGIFKEKFPCLNYLRVDPVFTSGLLPIYPIFLSLYGVRKIFRTKFPYFQEFF